MSFIEAMIIGILQGLTEFFPVSSSAHLKLTKILLGVGTTDGEVLFDLSCHLGTLVAVLYFLKKEIINMLQMEREKLLLLFLALVPLVPCYFLLKPLRDFASQSQFLGFFLVTTAGILFLGEKLRIKRAEDPSFKRRIKDVLCIGASQAAALIPGISRSASTISCARILGWDPKVAVRFSFLLAIPTIIGGNCLEVLKMALAKEHEVIVPISSCATGFLASCIVGLLVVGYAIRRLESGNLKPFAWYCLTLGLFAIIYLNFL